MANTSTNIYTRFLFVVFVGSNSTLAKNFVARLLETDPVLRMTATEALEHPWLRIVESGRLKTSMSIHDTTTSLSSVVKQGIVAAS